MDESNRTEMSLLTDNKDALCEGLCKFVVEIRKADKTVQLLCLLERKNNKL